MEGTDKLYNQAVLITSDYLGPAADRFLTRQIRNHLHINPEELEFENLLELVDWIKLAMMILTGDEKIVDEYISRLQRLANTNKSKTSLRTHRKAGKK
jgi:hypothetical protein